MTTTDTWGDRDRDHEPDSEDDDGAPNAEDESMSSDLASGGRS